MLYFRAVMNPGKGLSMPEKLFRLWCVLFVLAALAVALSIRFLDGPTADVLVRHVNLQPLRRYIPTSLLAGIFLAASAIMVSLFCFFTRSFPKWAEAVLLAAFAAAASLALARGLKPFFARPAPYVYVYNLKTNFGWHSIGESTSVFPSTHSALLAAALSILAFYYARARNTLILCVLAINLFMITGTWHFISDALAGSMVGFTVAVIAFGAAVKMLPGGKAITK
jgi:membrane-associated phospholipid phosphatase